MKNHEKILERLDPKHRLCKRQRSQELNQPLFKCSLVVAIADIFSCFKHFIASPFIHLYHSIMLLKFRITS